MKGEPKPAPDANVAPKPVEVEIPGEPVKKIVSFEAKVKEKQAEVAKKDVVSADDALPPAKPDADTPVPDEHKRVLPHDKPDTAKRIKAILAERDAAAAAAAAAKKEVEEAKKAGASSDEVKKLKDEYEALKADASRLRRLHDLKNDTEFNKKYDEPVRQVDVAISDTLKRYGFGEATLKAIEAEGGFAAFSRSAKTFSVKEPDPENPGQTRAITKTAAQLAREWVGGMDLADSEAVKSSLGKQQLLQSEKQAAIEKEQAEARAYFENQGKSQREAAEAAKAAQDKTMKEYSEWLAKAETETDFLKDREVPADATPEQKKAIESHNEFNSQLRANLRKDPTNAVEYGQLKLEAAEAHHLRRTLGDKDAEIAALKEQLKAKSAALRTTPKSGSILRSNDAPEKKGAIDPNAPTDFLSGLRKRVAQAGEDE